ncbi:MAG: ABC transporter ATP-binding protein [Lachnospiraceae bacterium]
MKDIILETKKLCKRFKRPGGTQTVLNKVNLQIYRGEMTAIRGKSGNGKSTLLNILAATMRADSGKVLYGDIDLQRLSNAGRARYRREKIGYIPQNLYLLDDRNVFMNIALPLQYAGEKKENIRKKVEEAAEWLDIVSLLGKAPQTLSRGEKQRVAICRSIVKIPEILFADEPTGSLDEENEQLVLEMFQSLKIQGTTIVLTTHDDSVSQICDEVYHIGSFGR